MVSMSDGRERELTVVDAPIVAFLRIADEGIDRIRRSSLSLQRISNSMLFYSQDEQ
jgi:hypothetical protein